LKFLIVTALKAEARPVIEVFKLSKEPSRPWYRRKNIVLLITGVGSRRAAQAVEQVLESFPSLSDLLLINIGIAGGPPGLTSIGEMMMINKITEAKSGEVYFPDMLIKHGLREMELLSVEKGIVNGSNTLRSLVDMEGAAIFRTGQGYLPPHRIVLLKIVSDYMDCQDFRALNVSELMQHNLKTFRTILDLLTTAHFEDRVILAPEDIRFLEHQIKVKRFSVTQSLHLFELAENYVARTGKGLRTVEHLFSPYPVSKQDRNQLYHAICGRLST